jgi:hypothetical protein
MPKGRTDTRDFGSSAGLWAGRAAAARPNLASWKSYLTATMREVALLVVEARPQ